MDSDKNREIYDINLKSFSNILIKRKTSFFISFCMVLVAGLVFTFIAGPVYTSTSRITLSSDNIAESAKLFKYFPAEAKRLWIIPTYEDMPKFNFFSGKFEQAVNTTKTDEIIDVVYSKLGEKVSKKDLRNSINISIDRWNGKADIIINSRTPELAFEINKSVLETFLNFKSEEIEKEYSDFLTKLDTEIKMTEENFPVILEQARNETASPILLMLKDWETDRYELMLNVRGNLAGNKEFFSNRILVLTPPEIDNVQNSSSFTRNILLSIVAAFAAGIITAFITNYFKNRN